MVRGTIRGGQGPRSLFAPVAAALILTWGCASSERPRAIEPEFDLHDPDPSRRIAAVHTVARAQDRARVPELIEMLDDRDEAVRLVAIGTLRDLTGHDTDYKAFAPRSERRAQVQAWRDWYAGSLPRVNPAGRVEPAGGAQ